MKTIMRRFIVSSLVLTVFVGTLCAQWTKTSSPPSGWVKQIFVVDDPGAGSVVFSFVDTILFRSRDNAETWTQLPVDSHNSKILALTCDAVTGRMNYTRKIPFLYAAGVNRVFRSTDLGTSWKSFSAPPALGSGIAAIAAMQTGDGGSDVFAATDSGMFIRTDGDTSWTLIDDDNETQSITAARNDSGKLWLYAGGPGLRFSTDRGISWIELMPRSSRSISDVLGLAIISGSPVFVAHGCGIYTPPVSIAKVSSPCGRCSPYFFFREGEGPAEVPIIQDVTSAAVIPQNNKPCAILLAGWGDLGSGVLLSRNLGRTWSLHNAGLQDRSVEQIAVGDSFVYAFTSDGFWKISLSDLLPPIRDTLTLSQPIGGEIWVAGATRSISWSPGQAETLRLEYSLDDGTTWRLIVDNVPADLGLYPWLVPMTMSGQCRIRITDDKRPKVMSITEGRFSIVTDGMSDRLSSVADSTVAKYVLGLEAFGTRMAESTNRDSVVTWIEDRFRESGITDVVVDSFLVSGIFQKNVVATIPGSVSPGLELIVGAHYDSYSWNALSAPGADDNASGTAAVLEIARAIRQSRYHPRATFRFIAFAAEELGLLGSQNYAAKAKTANRKIALMQNYDMIGHCIKTQPERPVMVVWYDGSEAEARLDSALKIQYTTLSPIMSTNYRSQSDSWSFVGEGFKAVFNIEWYFTHSYHTPEDSSTTLDFSYAGEIIRSGLVLLLSIDANVVSNVEMGSEPLKWAMKQNFPNPFNPSTMIEYQIPKQTFVSLKIFDLLGREVEVLVNEKKDAGRYSVQFDGSGLSSGFYFYRLQAGQSTETKKMILMK